jgi:hypothetical protein
MKNIFAQFAGATEKEATLTTEPLAGKKIKYRELTMIEADQFTKRLVKGYDSEGKPELDMEGLTESKYEKAALCLIEPTVTVEELKGFDGSFADVLTEINTLIDGKEIADEDEDEGNEGK